MKALCIYCVFTEFFIQNMPVMFIPPTVGLMAAWPLFKDMAIQFCVICFLTTIIVMVVTGHVSQFMIRIKKRGEACSDDSSVNKERGK